MCSENSVGKCKWKTKKCNFNKIDFIDNLSVKWANPHQFCIINLFRRKDLLSVPLRKSCLSATLPGYHTNEPFDCNSTYQIATYKDWLQSQKKQHTQKNYSSHLCFVYWNWMSSSFPYHPSTKIEGKNRRTNKAIRIEIFYRYKNFNGLWSGEGEWETRIQKEA